jgi:hypothetical protein
MNLRFVIYITAKKVRNRALDDKTGFKNKNNVITNINNKSEPDFDFLNNNTFDLILSNDYDVTDDNIKVN